MAGNLWGLLQVKVVCSLEQIKHYPPHCACTIHLLPEQNVSLLGGKKQRGFWTVQPELRGPGHAGW